jgi:spermidine synthase
VGGLYALNTAGAAAGAAAAGFWLLPALGTWGSVGLAALLNAAAGLAAVTIIGDVAAIAPDAVSSARREIPPPGRHRDDRFVSALFVLTGFTALAAEILWTRFLALLVPNSVHTYTIALTVTLVGIVLGSGLASWLADRASGLADRASGLALVFGGLLAGSAISVLLLMHLPPHTWQALGPGTLTYLVLLLPPTMCSGACLPVAVRLVLHDPALAAAGIGRLLALNTAGAIAGSLVAGFVLLPLAGLDDAVRIVTGLGVLGGAAAMVLRRAPGGRRWQGGALAATAIVAWLAAVIFATVRLPDDHIAPPSRLIAVAEGQTATLAAVGRNDDVALQIDRLWQGRRQKNHQIVAAHVPMLLHPHPRRVVVVGVGVGQTASRFLLHDVERVDCVDIEPAIFPFIAAHFGADWLRDPRVRSYADDGRTFIAHGRELYDVISLEVGQTFRPGVEAFYTREFYAAARQRLAPGGLVAQFVPLPFLDEPSLRRIVATFLGAFPDAVLCDASRRTPRWPPISPTATGAATTSP